MAKLRAVALDLWGTLIVDAPGGGQRRMRLREERLARAYERAGAGPGAREAVPKAIRHAIDQLVAAHQSNVDLSGEERLDAVRQSMLAQCPDTVEDAELLSELVHAVCESARWEPPDLIDGAAEELDELKRRGLKLAVVSNTGLAPGKYVERALRERGFERWIDEWIWSDVVRSWKPGRPIFEAALKALGVEADEIAFVGDTPEADILGARNAGLALSVQVGDKAVSGAEADIRLGSVRGLAEALELWTAEGG